MLVDVPLPVSNTSMTNCASSPPLRHAIRRGLNRSRVRVLQFAELAVDLRRRGLDQPQGAEKLALQPQAADRKILHGALRLRSGKGVRRYGDLAHGSLRSPRTGNFGGVLAGRLSFMLLTLRRIISAIFAWERFLRMAEGVHPTRSVAGGPDRLRPGNEKPKDGLMNETWKILCLGSCNRRIHVAPRPSRRRDRSRWKTGARHASADTLTDMMRASDSGVPHDLLEKARCVVVIPGMKKAGFIFGANYGRGFAVCRRRGGVRRSAPAAMRSGGRQRRISDWSSETDVVLLVMNDGGMKRLSIR